MLVMAWLCAAGADIWWMVSLTMVAAAAGTFSMPAFGRLVPDMADDDDQLGHANAVRATLDSLAGVTGPALAGLLIVIGGLPVAFALNGLSFASVAFALLMCRPPGGSATTVVDASIGLNVAGPIGWTALARRIAGPLALDAAISFSSAAIGVLGVLIAVDWLGADASFTGALNVGAGLGGVIGGVAAGLFINRGGLRGVIVGVVAFVGAMLVLGSVPVPVLAIGAMGVSVGGLVLLDAINGTAIQRVTADGGTGRAFGLLHTVASVWMMAGIIIPTVFINTMGVQAAIIAPALVMLGLGAFSVATHWDRRGRRVVHGGLPQTVPGSAPVAV
jgi:MFS transporter, DHA3 family, macrolide efflux protein